MRRESRWPALLGGALLPAAVLCFFTAMDHLEQGRADEGRRQLESSVRRAAVACYAAEGQYPPDLAYLETHYGVQEDTGRYTVRYEIFAENLMPDITVLENDDT